MITVLYVDDEPLLLDICALYLKKNGDMEVISAPGAREALDLLATRNIDVIVSDYQMPETDGIALLKEVRRIKGDMPFILFTGRGREEVVIEAINNGVDFYLQKGGAPAAQFAELTHKIRQAVDRRKAEQERNAAHLEMTAAYEELKSAEDTLVSQNKALEESRDALQVSELRLEALIRFYQMGNASLRTLTLHAIEEAGSITGSRVGYLAFLNEDESEMTMYAWSRSAMKECGIEKKPIRYKVDNTGLWGEAVRQRRAVITNDYSAPNPHKKGYPKGHVPIERHMNIPVFEGDRIVLVSGVANKPADYTGNDVKQLTLLMSGLWNVIRTRKLEEALDAEKKWFTFFMDHNPALVYIKDADLRTLYVSPKFEKLLGKPASELLGKTPRELFPGKIGRKMEADDREVLSNGVPMEFEDVFGNRRYHSYKFPVKVNDGNVVVGGFTIDITGQREIEEKLARSEETYQALVEHIQDGLFIVKSGKIRFANSQFAAMLGYNPEELLGTTVMDILSPDDRTRARDYDRRRKLGENVPVVSECNFLRKGGTGMLPARVNVGIAHYPDGVVSIATVRTLTESQRSEDIFLEREKLYQALIDTTGTGYVVLNTEGKVLEANDEYVRLTGRATQKDILKRSVLEWTHEHDRKRNMDKIRACIEEGTVRNLELDYEFPDGTIHPVEINATVVPGAGSVRILSLVRDITNRKVRERAIQVTGEKLSLLASITRHDVLNQLTVLEGYLDLSRTTNKDPNMRDFIEKMDASARVIEGQVKFMKDYEDLGMKAPVWQDLREAVLSAARSGEVASRLQVTCPPEGINVYADGLFQKVFVNLFDNTLRHAPKADSVDVSVGEDKGDLLITYKDNGPGVSHEKKETIFQKGYGNHTGFGLFLIREILLITGISIRETGEPGKGALFEIRVPKGACHGWVPPR
ncbi:MAG: PAS domain S-box protein [Methanoregulaceae archaeon]